MPARLEEKMKFSLALALETILDFFLCLFCAIILFRNRYSMSPFISNFLQNDKLENNAGRKHCNETLFTFPANFTTFFVSRACFTSSLEGFLQFVLMEYFFLENVYSMSFQRKELTPLVPNSRYLHDSFSYSDSKEFSLFLSEIKVIF